MYFVLYLFLYHSGTSIRYQRKKMQEATSPLRHVSSVYWLSLKLLLMSKYSLRVMYCCCGRVGVSVKAPI